MDDECREMCCSGWDEDVSSEWDTSFDDNCAPCPDIPAECAPCPGIPAECAPCPGIPAECVPCPAIPAEFVWGDVRHFNVLEGGKA